MNSRSPRLQLLRTKVLIPIMVDDWGKYQRATQLRGIVGVVVDCPQRRGRYDSLRWPRDAFLKYMKKTYGLPQKEFSVFIEVIDEVPKSGRFLVLLCDYNGCFKR